MTRHRSGMSRFLHDIVDDTKDLLDDITDSLSDVEHDTRRSVSRALRPDDDRRSSRRGRDRYSDEYDRRNRRDDDGYSLRRPEDLETQLTGLREELHRLVDLMEKDATNADAAKPSATSK
ncbi:hypothetical protein [Streptomyces sp. NPDC006285]|uniref:hypothetical protein n=1 Tax=Streptomyces sp. NPDC006285 TaxID=3364742 RepID=UPI0036831B80